MQEMKGFPVNPGLQTQSKVPLVEFPLMHRAFTPHVAKSHGSVHV